MPLIIRYVDKNNVIHESYIAFVECNGTSGEDIANLIEQKCVESHKLDMNMWRRQGYDGAGNMAGQYSGAAKLISTKYPYIFTAHLINLTYVLLTLAN